MSSACPSCGAPTSSGQRFCYDCGTRLLPDATTGSGEDGDRVDDGGQGATTGESNGSPVAERRVCSVLFADLVGFTPLSEARDPEEVRELLSQYFDAARTVVGRYGGVVEKFIGDAVMAVWGTPVAVEDGAERAVRAGLDLVAAVPLLGARAGVAGLAARVGVVTGEVAVNLGATNQGMVAGDAVNTASRVQAVATAGSVWVDEVTHRLAAPSIGFDDAGPHVLKGKSEPARLWSATRVLSGVGGAQRVDGLEAPMLGRDPELRTVRELFHATVDRRSPRMVLVSGPAGVGKSRLGWEFEKYIDGLADEVWWHRGRCLSYGDGVVFWALAEIVRQRMGIAEEDPTAVASAKLTDGLRELVDDETERAYLSVRLGRLLGVTVTGDPGTPLSREDLFAGWRLLFERLAEQKPVVLMVEDAQYADPGLLEFLDHLIDWARGVPIFVLVFARPELEHDHPNWGGGRNRTALALDPLDARSMDDLVEALVPGMPTAARRAITAQAQGIPLFAVETIRSLIDRDVVVPRDGAYRLVGDIGALAVPDSLHALLAARLDALDPQLRALVASAAVLGSTFPAEALIAVSGRDEASVREGLAELLRREVLEVSADKLSPQRGSYRFAQNLLRQVAYDTLSRRDRKARHLAVAAHLRATFPGDGDEVIDAIARHYRDALDAVPDDPDADQIRALAVQALRRGAERARRSGSPRGAAASYAAAAGLLEQSGDPDATGPAAELWEAAAQADIVAFDLTAALERADRAAAGYTAAGRPRAAARTQTIAGRALDQAGRTTEGGRRLVAALQELRPHRDRDTVEALSRLASHQAAAGIEDDQLSGEALALGQELDIGDAGLSELFMIRGLTLKRAHRPQEAIAHLEYAARLAERAGDGAGWGHALTNLADVLLGVDPRAAADAARTAWEHNRRVGARRLVSVAVWNLVSALILTGEWDKAEAAIAEATAESTMADDDYIMITPRARLAALRGDIEPAERLIAMWTMRSSEDPQDQADWAVIEMFIAEAHGDLVTTLDRARTLVSLASALTIQYEHFVWGWATAARVARSLGDTATVEELLAALDEHPVGHLPPVLRVERDLARARQAGDVDNPDAATLFANAIAAARRFGSPYHLAHGLLDQAEWAAAQGDADGAARLVAEARQIADRLGAAALAARADRVSESAVIAIGSAP